MSDEAIHTPPVRQLPVQLTDGVVLTCGADLRPEPIAWLWKDWLALGKLHILAGAPGQGKTTLALAMAATVTCGGRWPDGSRCSAGKVLVWSGEDDPADTLLPRLLAMGADASRVYFITATRVDGEAHPFDPARDMQQLIAEAERIGDVRLLVVDPVVSAVAGDSHKATEVRRALQPIVDLGAAIRAAVLGISHFSKGSAGRDPTERVVGSMAFGAVARVVLCAAKVQGDSDDKDRRILVRSKSNIGPDEGGFEYSIEHQQLDALPGIQASIISWGAAIAGTARELLAEVEADNNDGEAQDVESFLRALLADGPLPVQAIRADADGAGYSWDQTKRASNRIGVEKRKDGLRGGWIWALSSPREHEGSEGSKQRNMRSSHSSALPSELDTEEEVLL
ncbi:AAA family ATPase [Roseateles flavus]|uniref:AAA family ATPase n=1 Tax=Roseateles flavus TaxID=3149041 RepID=A0ABV0GAZ7_9BURK